MKKNVLAAIIFLSISTIFFLFIVLDPSSVGISYDWQTPASHATFLQTPITSAWHDGPITPNNSLYLNLYYSGLFSLGVSNTWATLLLLIIGVASAGYACFVLIQVFHGRYWSAVIGGLVYMASADLFLKIYFGWMDYLIGYALIPLFFYLFFRFLQNRHFTTASLAGLVFTVAVTGQPQLLVVVLIILFTYFAWHWRQWRHILYILVTITIVYLLMSIWWLAPYLSDINNTLVAANDNLSVAYRGFQNNAIFNIFQLPFVVWSFKEYLTSLHMPVLSYLWTITSVVLFAIPLYVCGVLLRSGRSKEVAPFYVHLIILVIGITLVKGSAPPFSITGDLFYKLPIISSLFRNINHLYYLIPFSISILIGLSFTRLFAKVLKKKAQRILISLTAVFVAVLLMPFILNVYQSRLHTYKLDAGSYNTPLNQYKATGSDSRLLWLPFGLFVKYNDDQDLDSGVTYTGVNPLINAVTHHSFIDSNEKNASSSLLTQLVAYGYCDRIPSCREKIIGLQSTEDIINLKRDFLSAIPIINDKQVYRDANWYSNRWVSKWLHGLTKTKKSFDNGAVEIFKLDADVITPHVYVATSLDAVYAQQGALFHGVTLDNTRLPAYSINPTMSSGATKKILPLDLTEDSVDVVSHNATSLFTTLYVPEAGDYELNFYQKRKTSTSPLTIYTVKSIDSSAKTLDLLKLDTIPKTAQTASLVKSGYIYLAKGDYSISFINSINANNNIFNSSFEDGIWGGVGYNCTPDAAVFSVVEETDRKHVLQIHNKNKDACQTVVVGDLVANQKYVFSYDIKHSSGMQPSICLTTTEDGYCRGTENNIQTNTWQHKEFIFEQGDSHRAIITLRVPASGRMSNNSLDNLELHQVSIPESIALVKTSSSIPGSVNLVEYRKIHDTKYRVILRGATGNVPLVLGERFDKRWRAYVVRTETALSQFDGTAYKSAPVNGVVQNNNLRTGSFMELNGKRPIELHQKVNGDSNLWMITTADVPKDVEVILEYSAQKILIIGQIIALFTAGSILAFASFVKLRQPHKNNQE